MEMLRSNRDPDDDVDDVNSWVSVCPKGLFKVQRKRIGEKYQHYDFNPASSYSPKLGAMCHVRVQLKATVEDSDNSVRENVNENSDGSILGEVATAFPRCQDSVLQVPLGDWITLRLGEGQCDITEACVEGMRAGEKCEILVSPVKIEPHEENLTFGAIVELKAFTSGKETWETPLGEKWEWVKWHKEEGGVRFRNGDLWGAADSYSKALKLLITLHSHMRDVEKKGQEHKDEGKRDTQSLPSRDQWRIMKAELHSNMSLCQLKLNQPERAKASAAKATELEPGGAKAWYRLGKACQMVNQLEEAKQAFRKLLELQPESPAATKALKIIADREKETNTQLGLRLSKMFS